MMGKYRITAICLAMAACTVLPVPAQTADEMDRLLETWAVSWGEAARLVLAAAGHDVGNTPEEAFQAAAVLAKLPKKATADSEISLGGLSLIIMKAFDLKGGLYRLFPIGHYAYRELVYLDIIQGRSNPGMIVSGGRLLRILGRVLDHTGTEDGGIELE